MGIIGHRVHATIPHFLNELNKNQTTLSSLDFRRHHTVCF